MEFLRKTRDWFRRRQGKLPSYLEINEETGEVTALVRTPVRIFPSEGYPCPNNETPEIPCVVNPETGEVALHSIPDSNPHLSRRDLELVRSNLDLPPVTR